MPRRVDHSERRATIAGALFRVAERDGLAAVSLRHVAAEAGVTTGMVQHYFASKDELMAFAMRTASLRYEERMSSAVAALGAEAPPAAVLRAVLTTFIPQSASEVRDGRIALEFQAYAAARDELSDGLARGNAALRAWIAELIAAASGAAPADAAVNASGLLATAEGLGLTVLSSGMRASDALAVLEAQLTRNGVG